MVHLLAFARFCLAALCSCNAVSRAPLELFSRLPSRQRSAMLVSALLLAVLLLFQGADPCLMQWLAGAGSDARLSEPGFLPAVYLARAPTLRLCIPLMSQRPPPMSARNRQHKGRRGRRSKVQRRRPRRFHRPRRQEALASHWFFLRLRHNAMRLGLLAGLLALTASPFWPVGACAGLLVLQEAALVLGRHLACPWLLHSVPWLARLAKAAFLLTFAIEFAQLIGLVVAAAPHLAASVLVGSLHPEPGREVPSTPDRLHEPPVQPAAAPPPFDPFNARLGAALAYSFALRNLPAPPPRREAQLELLDGCLHIQLPNASSIAVPACSQADQRLAMVIARLFKNESGKPLFSFNTISRAFGKKQHQDSQNRVRAFLRAGASLATLARECPRGRHRSLHPEVEKRLASYWERDPLATPQQCAQWLATQSFPDGCQLPSAEHLTQLTRLPGNLVTVRHSLSRLLSRANDSLTLRHDTLISRLFEVIEAQDRQLSTREAPPISRPGLVNLAAEQLPKSILQPTRTAKALSKVLAPLTTVPDEAQDLVLMSQVGLKELTPLHCATLYCTLSMSIGQVAALLGRSKSVIYRALRTFARAVQTLDLFAPAQHFSGVLGLDEKWLKVPKSYSLQERQGGKRWRYAHFAVDARSGDLLHVEVYETSDNESARAFLVSLRAMGLRPQVVVTDMWAGYSEGIREVFGERVSHHFCLFHHLQAVRERVRERCGKDWKESRVLVEFVHRVDHIYHCQDRRTAQKRLQDVQAMRPMIEQRHPEALPILELIEQRFPKVANALGTRLIPTTNNAAERTIRAFNQHYKKMSGLESLESARVQLQLFRFFYRLTPQRETAKKEERGKCPLERAGWEVRGIPVADYIRHLTVALAEEPKKAKTEAREGRSPPREVHSPAQATAA